MGWERGLARHCRDAGVGPAGAFSDGVREDFGGPVCLVGGFGAGAEGLPALVGRGVDWASVDLLDRLGLGWLRRFRAHGEVLLIEKNEVSEGALIKAMERIIAKLGVGKLRQVYGTSIRRHEGVLEDRTGGTSINGTLNMTQVIMFWKFILVVADAK